MSTRAKVASVAAIALVAVLGVEYSGNAASHHAVKPPIRNIAHVYTATDSGSSTGGESYTLPTPKPGVYQISFSVNIEAHGSPSAPIVYSCFVFAGAILAQSTASSTASSGFYVGLNGVATTSVYAGEPLWVGCGSNDESPIIYGTRPLQVTMVRLDGIISGGISPEAHPAELHRIDGQLPSASAP